MSSRRTTFGPAFPHAEGIWIPGGHGAMWKTAALFDGALVRFLAAKDQQAGSVESHAA